MKKFFLLVPLLLTMEACTPGQALNGPPLQYSFMPRYLDLDSIQPLADQDSSVVVDPTYTDFKSIAIDSGILVTYTGDTLEIPAGILISERKAAMSVYYQAAYPRHVTELKSTRYLMQTYYDKAKAAEVLYQDEIVRLKVENKRTWLEKNAGYIGFGAAMLVMAIRDYALGAILK